MTPPPGILKKVRPTGRTLPFIQTTRIMHSPILKSLTGSLPAPTAKPLELTRTGKTLRGLVLAAALVASQGSLLAAGPPPVDLGSAARFTILAGAAITTTGGGVINGDVGASPINGAAILLTQAQVNGTIFAVDASGPAGSVIAPAMLLTAKGDLTTAYNDAAGRTPVPTGDNLNPGAGNIGGFNLIPGLYKFTGTASITGADLTLTGGPDDVWIFQIGADLQVGSGIKIILAGGARVANIFWQVTTSVSIGTFAVFKGTILADQAIVMNTSSTMDGRALAFTAGVTFNGSSGTVPLLDKPFFTSITRSAAGTVTLVVNTTPYRLLTLQTSTTLLPGSWKTIASDTPVTPLWTYIHQSRLATGPKRFYRAYLIAD